MNIRNGIAAKTCSRVRGIAMFDTSEIEEGYEMKLWKYSLVFAFFVFVFGVSLFLTYWISGVNKFRGKLSAEQRAQIDSAFKAIKPVCFTRFVIDVPASADVVFGRMSVDDEIQKYGDEAKSYDALIDKQILDDRDRADTFRKFSTIKNAEQRITTNNPDLTQVVNISGTEQYNIHSFLRLGNHVYDLYANGVFAEEVEKFLHESGALARKFRALKENEIPAEDGVCIDGAFAAVRPEFENIQLGIRLKEFPDVHISIQTLKNLNHVPSELDDLRLFDRAEENAIADGGADWYRSIKRLRSGRHTVNGWSGLETLLRLPATKEQRSVHQFFFHAVGKKDDPFAPLVDIQMDTGVHDDTPGAVEPSVTDAQAVEIWERLLGSIRVRQAHPAVVKPGEKVTPPQTDRGYEASGTARLLDSAQRHEFLAGTIRSSGESYPVSGWWVYEGNLTAESERWIEIGAVMPSLRSTTAPTFWGRFFTLSESTPLNVRWQLHRVDEQPPAVEPILVVKRDDDGSKLAQS